MPLPRIYLSPPHMGGNELNHITNAFAQNWVAPAGPDIIAFEEGLQDYLGYGTAITALSSGTAALHLALILAGVERGDEVLCQSFTFAASANPIVYLGAMPVFVDSEGDSWNLCPNVLEDAIKKRLSQGKKPKAIIAVHLYGMPYKASEIHDIADKYGIPVIEDSAEALGSTYKGRPCGTFGDMAILSFNGNKIITTSGGGALVCKTIQQKDKALYLATQARGNFPYYHHTDVGYNYRMSNISACIGRGQIEVLQNHIGLRRQVNAFYRDLLKDVPGIGFQTEYVNECFSNYWLTALTFEGSMGLAETLRLALEEQNIESRPLWKPLHLQPVYKDAPYYGGNVCQTLFNKGLCLPSGSGLTALEKQRIGEVITKELSL